MMRIRSRLRRVAAGAALLTFALLSGSPAGGEQADPSISYEAWYFRAEPTPPIIGVPCTPGPTPCGPVSPGDVTAPNSSNGGYVVAFAGGQPGDDEGQGDTGWAAFQWDVFDAVGGTVEEFVVTLTQSPSNGGDFNEPSPDDDPPPIQACNVVATWAGAPTSNPWSERPAVDCASAVLPTVEEQEGRLTYTFDVTDFATTWIEGTGHGLVIRPGAPDLQGVVEPFQVTLAGEGFRGEGAELVTPKVTFRFSGAADLGTDLGGDTGGGFAGGPIEEERFAPQPELDVFPDDAGSEVSTPTTALPSDDLAAPPPAQRAARTGGDSGFPLLAWLIVPLALLAFWATGMSLGPAGEPTLPRQGGVTRVLAARRATRPSVGATADTPREA